MEFKLGNIVCKLGEKVSGFWDIEGYSIPTTIINGKKSGKIVAISSGIHNCEYVGIQSAIELSQEIDPVNINGTVIIFHPVNYSGFFHKIPAVMPEDNKNLNRAFPGIENGSTADKIAYHFSKFLYPQLDFFIDLHGGDLYERATNFVYSPGIGDNKVIEVSHEVAQVLSVPYRVRSSAKTGAYNSAAIQGVPSMLIERGGNGLWNNEEVKEYKKDILSVLGYFNIIDFLNEKNLNQKEISIAEYISSEVDGFWYPRYKAGEKFNEGDLLGEIKDCFGNIITSYYAEFDGVILYGVFSLAIKKSEEILAYGKI
ncbi:MAG: succinylglutamate desuccinylase/aspartoacylase family protein [Candidatus Fusobacterium pullicola]|uniref:Succinylglutamate desuccinylase/aspartoacylase family protein n=1 Tax=Candidatus Fusobacterium pullicola TaxID=2838601 RepID=A0A9E2KYX4_9FUSO|nr:succinylglutamate desuccinylase/aspartoacylase family protein [Candidatus Fusobacterium pullicola]